MSDIEKTTTYSPEQFARQLKRSRLHCANMIALAQLHTVIDSLRSRESNYQFQTISLVNQLLIFFLRVQFYTALTRVGWKSTP